MREERTEKKRLEGKKSREERTEKKELEGSKFRGSRFFIRNWGRAPDQRCGDRRWETFHTNFFIHLQFTDVIYKKLFKLMKEFPRKACIFFYLTLYNLYFSLSLNQWFPTIRSN